MRIGPFNFSLRKAQSGAPELPPTALERLGNVEDAVVELADDLDKLADRVTRFLNRHSAQKRQDAMKALDAVEEPTEGAIVAPEAISGPPDPNTLSAARRTELKAALRRRAMGG